ncbi:hypothetical protein AVEN_171553-1 [Araneus ventricosus]|uniref:HTH CENPB-type domain-containing protein n=1 Tax=Araneus ventricosus TaxID=182803 RepID=A0A4Y2V353_ARAVE|nr:hypothetical protein AVEN_171553-1 [Araneus ventricosus]
MMKNWTTFLTNGLFRKGVPIPGIMIQQNALNFNSKLGGSKEFQVSSGWLEKFTNPHGIEAGNSFIAGLDCEGKINCRPNIKLRYIGEHYQRKSWLQKMKLLLQAGKR